METSQIQRQENATQSDILAEIDIWKNESPKSWPVHLNNFLLILPHGHFDSKSWYDHIMFKYDPEYYDIQRKQTYGGQGSNTHSQLYLSQTPRQFFDSVYQTIDELPEISRTKIEKDQKAIYKYMSKTSVNRWMTQKQLTRAAKNQEKANGLEFSLYKYIIPIYVALRMKGYNHLDLVA